MNTILVQNIETFETIITLPNMAAFDEWMDDSSEYGIVSLDEDADGEHAYVALVASDAGPDYDVVTNEPVSSEYTCGGEPIPVLKINGMTQAEFEAKIDIAMEIDNADEEHLLALELEDAVADAAAITTAPSKPRNKRNSSKSKSNTQSQGKTMKNHEILAAFISANPNVTRSDVFQDPGLLVKLRSPAQIQAIANGDKLETKRWNSCINRFIRKIRRDGTDIRVNGMGKTATYSIGTPSGQLELPFNEAAEARNAAIIGDDANEAPVPSEKDAMRLVEAPNQSLDFEALLATLDDEAATVTSDDQEAFEAATEIIK